MADELHALDVELAHLEGRAGAVANAEERYTSLLRDLETAARARGGWNEELNALAATEAEIEANRHELAEIIAAAIEVQEVLREIVMLVRELHPPHGSSDAETSLFDAITGHTSSVCTDLCRAVACAQQGLRALERTWAHITTPAIAGSPLLAVTLPPVRTLVARDLLFGNVATLEAVLAEVSRASSTLVWRVSELRERDASYSRALAECARMRARLLDPAGETT
jgi:hypothetical protein